MQRWPAGAWRASSSLLSGRFSCALDHAAQQPVLQDELVPERRGGMQPDRDIDERGTRLMNLLGP
eukprot:2983-Eustigmatos_ZCMA.PRE.1